MSKQCKIIEPKFCFEIWENNIGSYPEGSACMCKTHVSY